MCFICLFFSAIVWRRICAKEEFLVEFIQASSLPFNDVRERNKVRFQIALVNMESLNVV